MSTAENDSVSLEEKLFTVRRRAGRESHIKLDVELCKSCVSLVCTYICPAEVFVANDAENGVDVRYENCLECGTCQVACEMCAIEWSNPIWGAGVSYRNS